MKLPSLVFVTLPVLALTLVACVGGPVPPDWQAGAHAALNAYSNAYLTGNRRVADAEFARARSELARTGRADLVARAELVRCGVQVASIANHEDKGCPGYAPLAADAGPAEQAYAAFLSGQPADPSLLPAHYRGLNGENPTATLRTINTPLPRLIAAGVLFNTGKLDPPGIQIAVDTASAEGWRRPLLAWLGVQEKLAESAGKKELAASLRRRMALVGR